MLNPYDGINWSAAQQIMTTTHDHVIDTNVATTTEQHFTNLYNGGVRCMAISNYYPSKPMYPLSDYAEEIGGVPADIIEVPNAEHHNLSINGGFGNSIHLNALGSLFECGHERGISPVGYAGTVENLIRDVKAEMLYEDGGGLTINHPTWTSNQNLFSMDILISILDMDESVLGIEIFNTLTWDLELWDTILLSGRRCWGFAVPDHRHKSHAVWYGRMILVVPELTPHECLKAFRNGNSYLKYANTDFKFTNISLSSNVLTAEVNTESTIRFIVDGYIADEVENTTEASYQIDNAISYIRVEAETSEDKLFSQPIMITLIDRKKHMGKVWLEY